MFSRTKLFLCTPFRLSFFLQEYSGAKMLLTQNLSKFFKFKTGYKYFHQLHLFISLRQNPSKRNAWFSFFTIDLFGNMIFHIMIDREKKIEVKKRENIFIQALPVSRSVCAD